MIGILTFFQKAEIEALEPFDYFKGYSDAIMDALGIIDKHCGKENE